VLALILREAKLPGWTVGNTHSFANVKASAFVRMDEQLTVFSVSEEGRGVPGNPCLVVCAWLSVFEACASAKTETC
jgi:hypothetical protein